MSELLATLGAGAARDWLGTLGAGAALSSLAVTVVALVVSRFRGSEPRSRHRVLAHLLLFCGALFFVPALRLATRNAASVELPEISVFSAGGISGEPRRVALDVLGVVGLFWAVGALLVLLRTAGSALRLWRLVDRALPAPQHVRALAGPGVVVRVSTEAMVPFVTGIFRPCIVLPLRALEELSPARLSSVLSHELVHVARRDVATASCLGILRPLFALNPAAGLLYRELELAREEAVDAVASADSPSEYAHALLDVAQLARAQPPVSTVSMGDTALQRRITLLTSPVRRPVLRRWPSLVGGVALLALAVVAPRALAEEKLGSLDKEEIRSTIQANRSEVASCYESFLAAGGAKKSLTIHARFTIAADGHVSQATAPSSESQLSQCLESTITSWTFPSPKGGGVVHVTYPFKFVGG